MSTRVITDRLLSVDEYADLPDDDWRTELVAGRLVQEPQPSYEHGRLQVTIGGILRSHVREHAPDFVVVGTLGVITALGPDTVRGPDVAVIARARAADLHRAGFLRGAPDIAIEVISPSNRAGEIHAKVIEYLAAGARLVWVVYPETRTVAVHGASGARGLLQERDELDGGEVLPSLRVGVAELFAE
jgi:Uma2 family endonuclease